MTADSDPVAERRAAFAHEVAARYGTGDPLVEAAFAKVRREDFLGPPPWTYGTGGQDKWAKTTDLETLYTDVLVALDRRKGINNGQPSLHAMCIAALQLRRSDHVLHIGAGSGYYTAILAELCGSLDAYEIDAELAAIAARNLAPWPHVTVHAETAVRRQLPEADAIYVSAGATHPDPYWLDCLRDGGRLLFPLTGADLWGGILLLTRRGHAFAARFLCKCGFIDCEGLRDKVIAKRLAEVFRAGGEDSVRSFTRRPPSGATVWFAGNGWYLSTDPP